MAEPTRDDLIERCVLRVGQRRQPLDAIFRPRSVALVGATDREGSVGRAILSNLFKASAELKLFPVNARRTTVLGRKSYPNINEIGETVDLAVIATPAPAVPQVVDECIQHGIPGAIIISAGFKETGQAGEALERRIRESAHGRMRIIGPNCLGVMNPVHGLNATFATVMARPGRIGFLSQSGALCTAILDWSLRENVGFSAFVSTGSMLDIGWGDLIYHLGDDPHTKSILIYMESIGDARAFLSAAREVSYTKPIIVIKAGRTAAAAKAATSHTGALSGSDEVLDAAFRRCGVVRVETIAELFGMAEVLSKQPRPAGPRLAILTNAGGPGVLATDAFVQSGGLLAEFSAETHNQLNALLPPHWSHGNPVDVLGDADPGRYARAFEIVAADPNTDGTLLILTPQAMTDPTGFARRLPETKHPDGKPILASWMGGPAVAEAQEILNAASIPTFAFPDAAARMFQYMWQYSDNLSRLYETPTLREAKDSCDAWQNAQSILAAARNENRTLLTETDSKALLSMYGIPVVETRVARSEAEAVEHADALGYPVAVKLHSHTITHKTDVGGVMLNLRNADEVLDAFCMIKLRVSEKAGAEHFLGVAVQPMISGGDYELILGSSSDPQFGPVLLFGLGGQLVEILKDRTLALPPLTSTLARHFIERTKIFRALQGTRGRAPIDLDGLTRIILDFVRLVVEQPRIKEIEINPLMVSPLRIIALDARVVLHDFSIADDRLPRPAIRPYPSQYISTWTMKNGAPVTLRPIRPEDEPLMVAFHQALSDQTVRLRYFYNLRLDQRVAHQRLCRICFIDYDREMALVAERTGPSSGEREIVAVGRLSRLHGINAARLHLLVADHMQGQGLGRELIRRLLYIAESEHIEQLTAEILPESAPMIRLCEEFGFQIDRSSPDIVHAEFKPRRP